MGGTANQDDRFGPLNDRTGHKHIASLFLLPRCDMGCLFCASETGFSTMTAEQARGLLPRLRAASFDNVVLGGGEPFLWPHDLVGLATRARDAGFLVQVCTNGVTLPVGFERIEVIDRYILPLESTDPSVHDRLRRIAGGTGHHALVERRLEELRRSGREVTVSTVVTRENAAALDAVAGALARLRDAGLALHAWHLYRFLPVGRGGAGNADRLALGSRRFRDACDEVRRRDLGFPVYRRDNMLRSSRVEFFWFEGGELIVGSRALAS